MFKLTITALTLASIGLIAGCAADTDDGTDPTEGSSALERGRPEANTDDTRRDDVRRDGDDGDRVLNARRIHQARLKYARRAAAADDNDRRDGDDDREVRGGDRTRRDADRPDIVRGRNTDDGDDTRR